MAGLSMAVPRGAMVIDLSKRKRKVDVDGPDTVATWNVKNPTHPRSGDGRWSATAGDVMSALQAWHAPRGSDDTGMGDWEAADLQSVKVHVTNLARAIEMEQHRRKASEMNPSKPLKVSKPVKEIPADLKAKLAEIRKRPMPGDREYLEGALKGLTVAQLDQVGRFGEHSDLAPQGRTKAEKIKDVVQRHVGILGHEAIVQGNHDTALGGDLNRVRRDQKAEFERRKKIAVERGDRDEYAALVAGYGTAGAGPGLPPEKPRGGVESITPRTADEVIVGTAGAEMHARNKARAASEAANPSKPLTASGSKPKAATKTPLERAEAKLEELKGKLGLAEDKRRRAKGGKVASLAESRLRGQIADARQEVSRLKGEVSDTPNDGSALRSSWMDGTFASDIDAIIAKPNSASVVLLTDMLGRLKVSELNELAVKHNVKLLGRTKRDKIESFVDSTVQNKLNSQAIRGGVADPPAEGSLAARQNLDRRIEELRVKSRDSRSESQRAMLDDKRRRLEAERDGTPVAAAPSVGKQAGPTHLDRPARTSGDGQFWGNHYHGDGVMGTAVQRLTEEQRALNIDGERLDDAIGDVIIEGHKGEIGVSQRQIAKFKAISAKIADPQAKAVVDQQIARLRPAVAPEVSAPVMAAAPAPLRKLLNRLGDIPDTGQGGREADRLAAIMRQWEAGELRAMRMDMELESLTGLRHESQEGYHEMKRAVSEAAKEIKAMGPALRQQQNEIRKPHEIRSTREALEEARANLVNQYGEDPDRWPEARQDREVEAYYDLRDKLRKLEG